MFTGFNFFVLIFNLPLRSQLVNLDNPETSGIRLLPLLGAIALGSFLGGAASRKKNLTFHTFTLGTAVVMAGLGLLSTLSSDLIVQKKLYGFEVVVGFGIGLTFSTISLLTTIETAPQDHGTYQTGRTSIQLVNLRTKLTLIGACVLNSCRSRNRVPSPGVWWQYWCSSC